MTLKKAYASFIGVTYILYYYKFSDNSYLYHEIMADFSLVLRTGTGESGSRTEKALSGYPTTGEDITAAYPTTQEGLTRYLSTMTGLTGRPLTVEEGLTGYETTEQVFTIVSSNTDGNLTSRDGDIASTYITEEGFTGTSTSGEGLTSYLITTERAVFATSVTPGDQIYGKDNAKTDGDDSTASDDSSTHTTHGTDLSTHPRQGEGATTPPGNGLSTTVQPDDSTSADATSSSMDSSANYSDSVEVSSATEKPATDITRDVTELVDVTTDVTKDVTQLMEDTTVDPTKNVTELFSATELGKNTFKCLTTISSSTDN